MEKVIKYSMKHPIESEVEARASSPATAAPLPVMEERANPPIPAVAPPATNLSHSDRREARGDLSMLLPRRRS